MFTALDQLLYGVVDKIIFYATTSLLSLMLLIFILAIIFKLLIYFTVRREFFFVKEFDKRLLWLFADQKTPEIMSFYATLQKLLTKTYYEVFELRQKYHRRRPDHIMTIADRLFLIQDGAARLIQDTLRQTRYLKKTDESPDMEDISKVVFNNNPAFTRIFGVKVLPISLFNDIISILPGLFLVLGIFGTFLGIMKALPQLGAMDISNVGGSKIVMDTFLNKIAFSMTTSIVGIIFYVFMTMANTVLSPDFVFYQTIIRYSATLKTLWQRCETNEVDGREIPYDQPLDPLEFLAKEDRRAEPPLTGSSDKSKESDNVEQKEEYKEETKTPELQQESRSNEEKESSDVSSKDVNNSIANKEDQKAETAAPESKQESGAWF